MFRFVLPTMAWIVAAPCLGRTANATGRYEFLLPDIQDGTAIEPSQSAAAPLRGSEASFRPPTTPEATGDAADALALLKQGQDILLRADLTRDEGRPAEAARLYETALILYNRLAREYPDWQPGLVKFRQAYCAVKAREMSRRGEDELGWQPGAWRIGPPAPEPGSRPVERVDTQGEPKDDVSRILARAGKLIEIDEPDEAIKTLLAGLRIDPDHADLRLWVGVAHCRSGRYEEALFVLTPLVSEHATNAYAHLALGTAYFGLARIEAARLALEQALKLEPSLHAAHYNLAQLLMTLNPPDMAGAQRHYREALRLGAERDKELEGRL